MGPGKGRSGPDDSSPERQMDGASEHAVMPSDTTLSGQAGIAPAQGKQCIPLWPGIRGMIRLEWRQNRHLLSMEQTRTFLSGYYDILDHLETSARPPSSSSSSSSMSIPSESTDYLVQLEERATKLVADHHAEREAKAAAVKAEKVARHTVKGRLTGGFMWPNAFLPPIPQMRPQPPLIDGMYRRRVAAKDKRLMRLRDAEDAMFDIKEEIRFLSRLGRGMDRDVAWQLQGVGGWETEFRTAQKASSAFLAIENRRSRMMFDERTMIRVERARKARHKTYMSHAPDRREVRREAGREKLRNRSGFLLNRQRRAELRVERWKAQDGGKPPTELVRRMCWTDDGELVMPREHRAKRVKSFGLSKERTSKVRME